MWRQGDLLFARIDAIPAGACALNTKILAAGDSTGHSHRLHDGRRARVLQIPRLARTGEMILDVTAEDVRIVHPEHAEIVLSQGLYRVWRQREWTALGFTRNVLD